MIALTPSALCLAAAGLTAFSSVAPLLAADTPRRVSRPDSLPRLVRTIDLENFGSGHMRFGDLDGDGIPDILIAQLRSTGIRTISCLTALNLDGRKLWQVGTPDIRNTHVGSDIPIQIFDVDRDGRNEVIYISSEDNRGKPGPPAKPGPLTFTVLNGSNGAIKKQFQLVVGWDNLLFADFSGRGFPQDMVVKDRMWNFWVFDAANHFKPLWSKLDVRYTGHYPMNYDFDGDGRDELLMGYSLYGHDGRVIWSRPELTKLPVLYRASADRTAVAESHNDAVHIDDMDGDGRAEIAIATSKDGILLDAAGKTLFQMEGVHCQHALIGKFRPGLPGKQVCFVDVGAVKMMKNTDKTVPGASILSVYSKAGELLVKSTDNIAVQEGAGGLNVALVRNWTGNPNENFILAFNRGWAPPALLDGHGREIATFPFPPGIRAKDVGPDGKDLYDSEGAQHLSCLGDEREEIVVFNSRALYIYTNAALWHKPYLYNSTLYTGR